MRTGSAAALQWPQLIGKWTHHHNHDHGSLSMSGAIQWWQSRCQNLASTSNTYNRNKCTAAVCQRISKYSFIRSTNTFSLIKVPTKSAFALTNLLRHVQMGVSKWSSQLKLRSVPAKILIDDWFNMYRQ